MNTQQRKIRILIWLLPALVVLMGGLVFSQSTTGQAGQPGQQAGQSGAPSQAPGGMPSDQARMQVQDALARISTELNLTADQKQKIQPILQSEYTQLKTVQDDPSMSPDQKRAKAKDIHDSASSQISSILTPEQQQKWQTMKQGAKEKGSQRPD